MSLIKLKKLIVKLERSKIISELINAVDSEIVIRDDEKILFGSEETLQNKDKYPIMSGESIIGWVEGNEKASSVAAIITHMANCEFEQKNLANETLNKYREINVLYKLSKKIANSHEIEIVSGTVIYQAMKYIESTCASIMLINEETGRLETISEFYKKPELKTYIKSPRIIIRPDDKIVKNSLITGKPEIVNDIKSDHRYSNCNSELRSIICAPLIVKNKVIGVITVGNHNLVSYEAEDLNLLDTFAFQASIAIENAKLYDSLKEAFFETVQTLSDTIEMKDKGSSGHAKRVAYYSTAVGEVLGLPRNELAKLKLAALLHDIGKMGVSDSILLKKGNLSEEETAAMRKHVEYGPEIIKNVKKLREVIPDVRGHHERYDGFGYPDALKGEEIPLIARIICVTDYFDAMSTDRSYRKAYSVEYVLSELRKGSGRLFDPKIVDAFLKIIKNRRIIGGV